MLAHQKRPAWPHINENDSSGCAYEHGHMTAAHSHDICSNDSLVVLAARDLAQVEQVPNDSDQEAVFLLLLHAATDGANGPAQCVEGAPSPLGARKLQAFSS
eukprot:1153835-Pelagomonas_calceolata.AAC.1